MQLQDFDRDALDIIRRLHKAGFKAYFVGGCLRDLLMGRKPKDFDIATNAHPFDVKRVVPRCIIVGRRFKLALALRGPQENPRQIEIATFRRESPALSHFRIVNENIYGTPADDALRRDFTLNGLFYDPFKKELLDSVNGAKHIKQKIIEVIGDPRVRFEEDPIRMLRAVRFAARLKFKLSDNTQKGILSCAHHLSLSVPDRIREELLRMLREGHCTTAFQFMIELKMLDHFLPEWALLSRHQLPHPLDDSSTHQPVTPRTSLKKIVSKLVPLTQVNHAEDILILMLKELDQQTLKNEPVPIPLALAIFLYPVLRVACFLNYRTWKIPQRGGVLELDILPRLHASLRLSHQELENIEHIFMNFSRLYTNPNEVDSKTRHGLLRNPSFSALYFFSTCVAKAHQQKNFLINCHAWNEAFIQLKSSGFKPHPWLVAGPYDRKDQNARAQPKSTPKTHEPQRKQEMSSHVGSDGPRPKKRRRRRRSKSALRRADLTGPLARPSDGTSSESPKK